MQSAKNLKVAERAMRVAKETYLVTKGFPPDERFGLTAQMRRSAVSIGSNIAEGCGRGTDRDFCGFLHIALGSASELEFQLELASGLELTTPERSANLHSLVGEVKRMLARLIVAVKARERRPKQTSQG